MTRTGAAARPPAEERAETFMEWLRANNRLATGAALIVAAAGLGGWLYVRNQAANERRAEQAVNRAQQALASNNIPLALADLQKAASQYRGTASGTQASLLVAQLHYDQGNVQQGIDELQKALGAEEYLDEKIHTLIADGYSQMSKPEDAARHYEEAARASRFEADRSERLAMAARSLMAANKPQPALEIWRRLAADPKNPFVEEARLRVGELEAKLASTAG